MGAPDLYEENQTLRRLALSNALVIEALIKALESKGILSEGEIVKIVSGFKPLQEKAN
ncbi:MAG TPA: hypothetical protein VHO28_03195 [Ignavibacteriales bacterium]|nr:hypothetical protein [Ignavibacteriales bacterium]HEX3073091.1 hypothetical protein [Ignavibacteriales bacterium]